MKIKVVLLGTLIFTFLLPVAAKAQININIVSDSTWTVSDTLGNDLGSAQHVCLNQSSPTPCPPRATVYGYPYNAWTADLSSIPGAKWIWAPNITGASSPAANAGFIFQTQYYLCCTAQSGTISIAADNYADIFIDGIHVSTSADPTTLSTINIPSAHLAAGHHIIKVKVKNGANPSDCGSDQYSCNPAAMVFKATITDTQNKLPTCTKSDGTKVDAGYMDQIPCTVNGQAGFKSRLCACITCTYADWVYGPCTIQAQTCKGDDGLTYTVGGSPELLKCPPGYSGSRSRACIAQDTWGPITGTCNPLPPATTCTGSDGVTTFLPGASETVPCGTCDGITRSRTCQADGNWTTFSECILLPANAGEMCGNKEKGECRTCPTGTTCQPKRTRVCEGWWIFRNCYYIVSTDYYCLPN